VSTISAEQTRKHIGEGPPIDRVEVAAYTIPTDQPESDGTFAWNSTTMIVVTLGASHASGLGYSYTDAAAAVIVERLLKPVINGRSVLDIEGCYDAMVAAVRNVGRQGVAATAIAAVDIAMWDAKARLLGVPLLSLLGAARDRIAVYGSGGFTSYSIAQLQRQFSDWSDAGLAAVKMKIGRDPAADRDRVHAAREAIGGAVELFVDANGAYDRKQALAQADAFGGDRVSWFEEPVSSDDLEGLRLIRNHVPAGMEIAAGEYGYDVQYFHRMIDAQAVDVLQADATRCCGITGFLRVGALADAGCLPMSAHTAPGVHRHVCCAVSRVRNLEYFHDHVRIEQMLFDGAAAPVDGMLIPDRSRPGLGLEFKRSDAERFAI
jgi:L-alanine-DL-glutamate epimerase-like enolase superfamily enzyme